MSIKVNVLEPTTNSKPKLPQKKRINYKPLNYTSLRNLTNEYSGPFLLKGLGKKNQAIKRYEDND